MLSHFVELKHTRQGWVVPDIQVARQQVKVVFQCIRHQETPAKTTYAMVMCIGIDICQQLQLQAGDKIKFFTEKQNRRIWHIKKTEHDVGYTLFNPQPNKVNSRYLKFQVTWQFFKPTPSEVSLQPVSHEFFQDGLLIRLPQ